MIRTGSVTWPAAVLTVTNAGGGPMVRLSAKATEIVPAERDAPARPNGMAESKSSWIHWPSGPSNVPDSHAVAMFESKAAYGSVPVDHWPGDAVISAADEDAVTFVMPAYWATVRYLLQPGSV